MSPRLGLDINTILQAATELADTHGLDEVTLATLAKKLNIRPPSLYNHIDGLQGLRKELAVYGLNQLCRQLTNAAIGRSGDEAVIAVGKSYVTFAHTHSGLYEATLRMLHTDDKDIQDASNAIVDIAIRILQVYELDDEAALHIVRGLRSIFHGFASLEQKGGFGLPLDVDESLCFVLTTFLSGIHMMKQRK